MKFNFNKYPSPGDPAPDQDPFLAKKLLNGFPCLLLPALPTHPLHCSKRNVSLITLILQFSLLLWPSTAYRTMTKPQRRTQAPHGLASVLPSDTLGCRVQSLELAIVLHPSQKLLHPMTPPPPSICQTHNHPSRCGSRVPPLEASHQLAQRSEPIHL